MKFNAKNIKISGNAMRRFFLRISRYPRAYTPLRAYTPPSFCRSEDLGMRPKEGFEDSLFYIRFKPRPKNDTFLNIFELFFDRNLKYLTISRIFCKTFLFLKVLFFKDVPKSLVFYHTPVHLDKCLKTGPVPTSVENRVDIGRNTFSMRSFWW